MALHSTVPRPAQEGISPFRWFLKKSARLGLIAGAWGSAGLGLSLSGTAPQLRVLTYHRFGTRIRDPFCVAPADFAAQMVWLAENQLAAGIDEVKEFVAGRRSLDHDKVLVTIDDGHLSTLTEAAPVLRDTGVPAVAFVTPSRVRREAARTMPSGDYPEPFLNWDELARLADYGVMAGSHSWTHRSLGRMTISEARDEAEQSRAVLEERLGQRIDCFAYPFGTRADFSESTAAILAKTGYALAFTSQHGAIRPDLNPLALPRIKIEGGEALWLFQIAARGGLDGWRLVDHLLWRMQLANRA